MTDLNAILRSGYCTRWHANPDLAHIRETLAEHHARVAQIICALHPNPSANLIKAALHHDCGEMMVGDLPWPFKQRHPTIAADHAEAEALALATMGIIHNITAIEQAWLKMADRLAAIAHVAQVAQHLMERADWRADCWAVMKQAEGLGCTIGVLAIMSKHQSNIIDEVQP